MLIVRAFCAAWSLFCEFPWLSHALSCPMRAGGWWGDVLCSVVFLFFCTFDGGSRKDQCCECYFKIIASWFSMFCCKCDCEKRRLMKCTSCCFMLHCFHADAHRFTKCWILLHCGRKPNGKSVTGLRANDALCSVASLASHLLFLVVKFFPSRRCRDTDFLEIFFYRKIKKTHLQK